MKNTTIKNNKNKSPKELKALIVEKTLALRSFRFSIAGSNVRNVKEGKFLKKDIARIMTLLSTIKSDARLRI